MRWKQTGLDTKNSRSFARTHQNTGNNDNFVDSIATDLFDFWAESTKTFTGIYGEPPRPTGISITAYAPGGAYTGATPDGRKFGETLPDGTASPAQGTDTHGPTASLASAMKIHQDPYNAMLLNMKIHPSALKTDEDLRKLGALIKTYLLNGGKHIQFNVVDKRNAAQSTGKAGDYRDLVVRVAGYSAYFTLLTPAVRRTLSPERRICSTKTKKLKGETLCHWLSSFFSALFWRS